MPLEFDNPIINDLPPRKTGHSNKTPQEAEQQAISDNVKAKREEISALSEKTPEERLKRIEGTLNQQRGEWPMESHQGAVRDAGRQTGRELKPLIQTGCVNGVAGVWIAAVFQGPQELPPA